MPQGVLPALVQSALKPPLLGALLAMLAAARGVAAVYRYYDSKWFRLGDAPV
jgi:hypothetical protein